MQCFGVVDDQVGATAEGDVSTEARLNLSVDVVLIERQVFAAVQFQYFVGIGIVFTQGFFDGCVDGRVVGNDLGEGIIEDVAQQCLQSVAFAEYFGGGGGIFQSADEVVPFFNQIPHVFIEFFDGDAFAHGSHDHTKIVWADAVGEVFESGFFFGVTNFPTDGDVIGEGDEDEVSSGDGDIASHFWSFVGDGLFDHLDQEWFAGLKYLADFTCFDDGFFDGKFIKITGARLTGNGRFDHFAQGFEIWAEIEIRQKTIFLTTYMNEGGIE